MFHQMWNLSIKLFIYVLAETDLSLRNDIYIHVIYSLMVTFTETRKTFTMSNYCPIKYDFVTTTYEQNWINRHSLFSDIWSREQSRSIQI